MSGDVEPAGGRRWHRRADGAGLRRTARAAGPASSPDPVSFSLASRSLPFSPCRVLGRSRLSGSSCAAATPRAGGGGAGGASTTPHGPLSPRVSATPSGRRPQGSRPRSGAAGCCRTRAFLFWSYRNYYSFLNEALGMQTHICIIKNFIFSSFIEHYNTFNTEIRCHLITRMKQSDAVTEMKQVYTKAILAFCIKYSTGEKIT